MLNSGLAGVASVPGVTWWCGTFYFRSQLKNRVAGSKQKHDARINTKLCLVLLCLFIDFVITLCKKNHFLSGLNTLSLFDSL